MKTNNKPYDEGEYKDISPDDYEEDDDEPPYGCNVGEDDE